MAIDYLPDSILLFDGSVRQKSKLVYGDVLMGPDSAPRKVLNVQKKTCLFLLFKY